MKEFKRYIMMYSNVKKKWREVTIRSFISGNQQLITIKKRREFLACPSSSNETV